MEHNFEELTIGIEEEYQIVDQETGELTSYISEFLDQGAVLFREQVKPELLQSQVEVGSHVCRNIQEAKKELKRLRGMINEIAEENGRKIVAAGTHPFSSWKDQLVTEKARYEKLISNMQYIAKRLLIFGMHIHVGVPDKKMRIDVMNQLRYFLPHILTLSTSSPFWMGEYTGFKSFRSVVFENLPRTGLPDYFESAGEYDRYIDTLVKTNCIEDASKIWWDVRPHPTFPTLEVRVCDCVTKVDEAIAIAALIQALVAKLIQLRKNNQTWRHYRRGFVNENKFRAIKEGVEGDLIDFGKEKEIPTRSLILELIEFLEDVIDQLGTEDEIAYIQKMLQEGTSAERQLETYRETDSMDAVMDQLIDETLEGVK